MGKKALKEKKQKKEEMGETAWEKYQKKRKDLVLAFSSVEVSPERKYITDGLVC